nr:hypothetical protein [uncultured Agathobaculum sp.]
MFIAENPSVPWGCPAPLSVIGLLYISTLQKASALFDKFSISLRIFSPLADKTGGGRAAFFFICPQGRAVV